MKAGVRFAAALVGLALVSAAAPGLADDPLTIPVVLQDHKFTPAEIHVPAGKPVVLRVENRDATPDEFDSSALKVEKVILGGHVGDVRLRPLGPGRYPFMGEFHSDTAQGVVIAE